MKKLNHLVPNLGSDFDEVYDSSRLKEIEKKYSSYM